VIKKELSADLLRTFLCFKDSVEKQTRVNINPGSAEQNNSWNLRLTLAIQIERGRVERRIINYSLNS